jgi:hypothetical protein
MALDKALAEAVRDAVSQGASWNEIGRVLGVTEAAETKQELIDALGESKRNVWRRLWP